MAKTLFEHMQGKHERYKKLHSQFMRVFGRSLKPYWDLYTGFDIFAFEDAMYPDGTPDGMSLEDCIGRDFGTDGVSMIERCLA